MIQFLKGAWQHRILIAIAAAAVIAAALLTSYLLPRKQVAKAPVPVPVTLGEVQRTDFPVYLTGLGTVQPYDTVTVRSRVDGQVIKVGFKQGQMVKEGDILVQIDPRPYQAALDQAVAKKAQDEANLKNAQVNLGRYSYLAKQDFASKQQLDTQQATVDQLKAQIEGGAAIADRDLRIDARPRGDGALDRGDLRLPE